MICLAKLLKEQTDDHTFEENITKRKIGKERNQLAVVSHGSERGDNACRLPVQNDVMSLYLDRNMRERSI